VTATLVKAQVPRQRPPKRRSNVFVITGFRRVNPQYVDQYLKHIAEMAQISLSEPGCLRYDILQDNTDPTVFGLYECFVDEAAARAHQAAPAHNWWREVSRDWYDGERLGRWEMSSVGPER
jgi:(4S)-4-hydroxy-5-phosphonooxypentane-2,3-dione isomerase